MAHVIVSGLAEILADHEDKLAAAQAWCEQQNIGSIEHAWPRPTDDFSSPLHDLRRSVVDAKRWAPGWKPQRWQEYYHTGPGFPEAEGPAQDPRIINEHSRPMSPMGDFSSDDEDADEPVPAPAEADPEEDAELICRPRTIGGIPQTRE